MKRQKVKSKMKNKETELAFANEKIEELSNIILEINSELNEHMFELNELRSQNFKLKEENRVGLKMIKELKKRKIIYE